MKKVTVYSLVLIICFSFNSYLFSQETTKSDKSLGSFWYTEYWFSVPPCLEYADDEANEIIIYVVAENDEEITVEIPGKNYKETKSAEAYQICTFSLSPSLGQCYRRKANDTVPQEKIYAGYGIHIYGEAPIIASCFINYAHASEAINILPMTVLGREYVVSGYNDNNSGSGAYYPAECAIVAIYDKTIVMFTLGGNDSSSTTGGLLPDSTKRGTFMGAGDVWVISSSGNKADLSGSKIMSTKPVSVISGNYAATIPGTGEPLNYIADMLIPQYTGGKIFYIPNIPGRKNPPLIRVYAREEGTTVYRNGEMVGFLEDAGGLISKAYLEMRLNEEDAENQYACISADKPITVSLFNPGYQDDENGFSYNSPFMMDMIPLIQFENEKTFVIPDFDGETEHYLNFVFEKDENGDIAGSAMLGKYEEDDFTWDYITDIAGEIYDFEYENEGKNFAFKNIKIEAPGVYKLRADVPFALYSYGHNNEKSYGYPVISNLGVYERPDTVAPEIDIEYWPDDGTVYGYVVDMPDNDTIRVNMATIYMKDSKNYNLLVDDFEAGTDRETTFLLYVSTIFEDAEATIIATDRNGNESSQYVSFPRKEFYLIPDVLDFGILDSGDTKTMELKIINRSTEKPVVPSRFFLLSDLVDTLDNQGFVLENISLPDTLESTDTIYAKCTFTAEKTGIYTDSVGIGDTTAFGYITYLKAIVSGPGGINDNEDMEAMSVYPNPADGEVNIILPDSYGIINNIEIYTIDGRKIYSEEHPVYNDNKIRVNTSAFPEGHYNIKVNTGKKEYTYSLIILH